MHQHISFIRNMVDRGGPDKSEYRQMNSWLRVLNNEIVSGDVSTNDLSAIREAFGPALGPETMQGFSFQKPHGYSGDFEIIDKIYTGHLSPIPDLVNWDHYFHWQNAPRAVRNRKDYFINLLNEIEKSNFKTDNPIHILNVASGPARDLLDFYSSNSNGRMMFDCIEFDPKAIKYATTICSPYLNHINFMNKNAFKFRTDKRYRLIWSGGLFDYFDDNTFVRLLNRYVCFLEENGEMVIGNFSTENPTRNYMEIVGDWRLNHRSADRLIALATSSGIDPKNIRVGQEPEGVNLFLHIKNGPEFIGM